MKTENSLKWASIGIALIALGFVSEDFSYAQSTFDLKPPMQLDSATTGIDPTAIPTYVFAVAVIDSNGNVEIERSLPDTTCGRLR